MSILMGTPSDPYWKRPTQPWKTQPDSNMNVPWLSYPHDDQATLTAPYREDLSLGAERHRWASLWWNGPLALVCHLRMKLKLKFKSYLRSYEPSGEDVMRDVESSFAYFVKLEARLLMRSTQVALARDGAAAVQAFMEGTAGDGTMTEETDFVFVSIDFVGQYGQKRGIKEFGVATLDTGTCFRSSGIVSPASQAAIKCFSYARTQEDRLASKAPICLEKIESL